MLHCQDIKTKAYRILDLTSLTVEEFVLTGTTWQRCRVHTMRNILAHVPQRDKSLVVAAIRTIFAQPNQAEAKRQLSEVLTTLRGRWDKAAEVLEGAADDVLAYMAFPHEHWARLDSTNPLERLNREVKRRTEVVGVFPDTDAVIRLVGSVLIEIDDEWQVERRYFSHESMQRRGQLEGGGRSLPATPRLEPVR
jgi:putative transposase